MRIALFLVVLVTTTSMLVGCQGLERGGKSHLAPEMRGAQVFEMFPTGYGQQFVTTYPDAQGSRLSLLDRIRGRRTNCPTSTGFAYQTAGINTIVASPLVNACSSCNQLGDCSCQRTMKTVSAVRPGKSNNPIKETTNNDESVTENAVVPPPPSLKHRPNDGKMMISSKVIENAVLSSVAEPEQPKKIPAPAFGIYERTAAPDFVVLPRIEQEGDDQQTPTNDDKTSPRQELENDHDFTPPSQPIFPELPAEPGALLKNSPVNALPASSPKVDFSSETPQTILPDSLSPLPVMPMPQIPIQDPVNERLALVPDQVAEISDQISEISKRVAELSERVCENTRSGAAAPIAAQPAAMTPAVDASEPAVQVFDQPVVLKARPKENFSLTDNRAAAREVSPSAQNQPQIPIYNVSHHALNQQGSPNPADGEQALSQMDTPNFSSPAVAKRAQTQLPLRYESDAKRAQEQFFDIQTLIQKEIDRRIREGRLVPVNKQPAVEPESPIEMQTDQTGDLNRIPVLQVSQPVIKATDSTAERANSQSISLPLRRPAAPVQEFDIPADDDAAIHDFEDEDCGDSAEDKTPNLFVPVLEIETLQPQLIEMDVDADPNDDTRFDQGVQTPSRINGQAIPSESGATIIQTNRDQALATQSQQFVPIQINCESAPIQNESEISENNVMLRLRATANPTVPLPSTPIVRIRNVSTQFRYQQPQSRDAEVTPLPSENYQPETADEEPGMREMEIKTIRALPIHDNQALQQEIRGLTERPAKQRPSAARIIER